MNSHKDSNPTHAATAPRARWRWSIGAALAFAAGALCTSFASGSPALPVHQGHPGHMTMTPEAMQAHIDKMVELCAADASPDQKMRLAAVAKAAIADLLPVHAQFAAEHARAHALLMAPTIDRGALEQWRAAQMQRMDFMSRRMAAAVEDGAEVLTPEQRASCGGRLATLMH